MLVRPSGIDIILIIFTEERNNNTLNVISIISLNNVHSKKIKFLEK